MCELYNKPIKCAALPDVSNVTLQINKEKFVDVYSYSGGEIKVNMQYAKNGIPFAINTAYLRETVAEKLLEAKALLPSGYTFEIFDAWRPYEVQLSLYNIYKEEIKKSSTPNISEKELNEKISEFVSLPDKNKQISFVHSSGGAVDLTVLDYDGRRLDMGSDFDEFTNKSYTCWYEQNSTDELVIKNRRLLYNVMTSCGFTNFPSEWWHYDFGDAFWAYYKNEKVIYPSEFEERNVKKYG
ncbi:MAG: M15 family metallopeptidase [Acutalibacteraceae bacterium]|nr:M15 family metallopeptidase [Acutalibacteraceae bacterium]